MSHFMVLIPLRRSRGGAIWTEVACWQDHFDAVALGCACGYQHRLLDPRGDLGVEDLHRFVGEISLGDQHLELLTAQLDSSPHAAVMVPAFQDLTEPTEVLVLDDMEERAHV
ncbi:hypothetical protein [Geodermatophilus sp. SYSU D00079]